MINEEKRSVQIYVINSNTGNMVRSERIVTNESLITVATICQHVNVADTSIYDVLLKCIDDIWETRYYSRFLRRGKND